MKKGPEPDGPGPLLVVCSQEEHRLAEREEREERTRPANSENS